MFEAFFHCFIVESWVVICVGVGAQRDVTAVWNPCWLMAFFSPAVINVFLSLEGSAGR